MNVSKTLLPLAVLLAAAMLLGAGCGDDGEDMDVDAGGDDAGTMEDAGGDDAGGTDAGDTDGGGGAAPVINEIAWQQEEGCTAGTASDVTITVDVTDPDNDVSELTFSGSVTGCTPVTDSIDGPESVIQCPQAAPYNGNVTVTDPDDNSDSASFSFGVCENGSVMP